MARSINMHCRSEDMVHHSLHQCRDRARILFIGERPDLRYTSATVEIEDQWLSQQSLANSSILRPTVATTKLGFPPMAEIQTKTPPHLSIRLDPAVESDILATLYQSPADPPAMLEMVPPQEFPMRKRHASLRPCREQPALPVLPAQSRSLMRPNC